MFNYNRHILNICCLIDLWYSILHPVTECHIYLNCAVGNVKIAEYWLL